MTDESLHPFLNDTVERLARERISSKALVALKRELDERSVVAINISHDGLTVQAGTYSKVELELCWTEAAWRS